MTAPTVGDRRRHARVCSRLPVRLNSQDGRGGTALACDVAVGGLGIEIRFDRYVQSGLLMSRRGRIDVEVDLPSGHTVRTWAEMVWWHLDVAGEAGRYRGGLRFLKVGPGDEGRVEEFVKAAAERGSRGRGPEQGANGYVRPPRG